MPKKPKYLKRVEIDWVDSIAQRGWQIIEEVVSDYETHGLNRQKTIGFIVQDTPDFVTVAQSLSFENSSNECYRGADFISIPKGCIKKIIDL